MNETLVIIPTYNEAKNITKLINELKKINVDILMLMITLQTMPQI